MRIEDVRSPTPSLALSCQDHDHEPPRAKIVHVTAQMFEFLGRSQRADQCPLKSSEKPVL
jgi:hypothetical protein